LNSVSARVQGLKMAEQILVVARLAEARSESNTFAPKDIDQLLDDLSLPRPSKTSNVLSALEKQKFLTRKKVKGAKWTITPSGRLRSQELAADIDIAALRAEASMAGGTHLGSAVHPVIPPGLAPPGLIHRLKDFLEEHPFERNVFGMTRFPDDPETDDDPVGAALVIARDVCAQHGLEFHLASDRAIDDDLWTNVAAHMWAAHYGIAFFEDRRDEGLNYNLTIEVGSMLMAGRRCALLKDISVEKMPTDLVGKIYKPVDLGDLETVETSLHAWIRDDLAMGACSRC
jgi:hypothetical protein